MKFYENVIRLSILKNKVACENKTTGLIIFVIMEMPSQIYEKIFLYTFYENLLSKSPVIT